MAEMMFINNNSISDLTDDYVDTSRIDVSERFFYYEDTANYFPTLHFDADHVPSGNATMYCIFLKFIEKENKRFKDEYRNFTGFPECHNAFNPKFRWQETDSKYGQDFRPWY
jgi:hypothetical protein